MPCGCRYCRQELKLFSVYDQNIHMFHTIRIEIENNAKPHLWMVSFHAASTKQRTPNDGMGGAGSWLRSRGALYIWSWASCQARATNTVLRTISLVEYVMSDSSSRYNSNYVREETRSQGRSQDAFIANRSSREPKDMQRYVPRYSERHDDEDK